MPNHRENEMWHISIPRYAPESAYRILVPNNISKLQGSEQLLEIINLLLNKYTHHQWTVFFHPRQC